MEPNGQEAEVTATVSKKQKQPQGEYFTILRSMEGRMVSKETRKKVVEADIKGKIRTYSKELLKELRE